MAGAHAAILGVRMLCSLAQLCVLMYVDEEQRCRVALSQTCSHLFSEGEAHDNWLVDVLFLYFCVDQGLRDSRQAYCHAHGRGRDCAGTPGQACGDTQGWRRAPQLPGVPSAYVPNAYTSRSTLENSIPERDALRFQLQQRVLGNASGNVALDPGLILGWFWVVARIPDACQIMGSKSRPTKAKYSARTRWTTSMPAVCSG
eukprot:1157256-Pelagomonas_calceolata.AAC.8